MNDANKKAIDLSRLTCTLLEETVLPSPHSVDLNKKPEYDFLYRFHAKQAHIAELFQENTKWTPYSAVNLPPEKDLMSEIRNWYFQTSYQTPDEVFVIDEERRAREHIKNIKGGLGDFLGIFSRPGVITDLLFSIDLLLLHEGRLFRVLAEKDFLWVEKNVTPERIDAVKKSILGLPESETHRFETFVFLVGCSWRYMLLYGPRGYRHTLVDIGKLISKIEDVMSEYNLEAYFTGDFYDRHIDNFLLADGVERSTMGLFALLEKE